MEYVRLGRTNEKIPVLGIGTWNMGANPKASEEAIRYAIEHGMNFVDTAEYYRTEGIVARAVAGHEVFVATKVSPHHFSYDDVIRSCDASLRELGVKAIDLYQLHWPNRNIPIEETMRAMERLVKDGKIRHIGVSNFSAEETAAAQAALKSCEIVSNQVEYSPMVRDIESDIMPYCRKNGITIIAYSPLGHGKLLGREYGALRKQLEHIGGKYERTAIQATLNWIISKGNISAIPKASSVEHVKEILGASGWKLGSMDMAAIDHFLSDYRGRSTIERIGPGLDRKLFVHGIYKRLSKRIRGRSA
ncbi:MAG: aldo/keto reductase [Candidatus Micrarchaeota archaeon]|nr:aldo/keto reductase [Candidatus Micrarchaeota archaeon]